MTQFLNLQTQFLNLMTQLLNPYPKPTSPERCRSRRSTW